MTILLDLLVNTDNYVFKIIFLLYYVYFYLELQLPPYVIYTYMHHITCIIYFVCVVDDVRTYLESTLRKGDLRKNCCGIRGIIERT